MIRINLLTGADAHTPRRTGFDAGQRVTVVCSVILVLTVVVIGWRYWSLRQESVRLEQEVTEARQELQRLAPILEQVAVLEQQRAELAVRVTLVEELRRGQNGPVRILDELSRALPDGVWLSRLEQDDGVVVVEGSSLALGSLSDFMANLEGAGFVDPPVEIVESRLEETDQGEVVRFGLRARFAVRDF